MEATWLSELLDMHCITDQIEPEEAIYENSQIIVDAWISFIQTKIETSQKLSKIKKEWIPFLSQKVKAVFKDISTE